MKKLWLFLSVSCVFLGALPFTVAAATRTVCADACAHTTITAAEAVANPGDVISVQATYDRTGESFPLVIDVANVTVSCVAGATIGQSSVTGDNTFQLTTSSTVSGCGLSNVNFYTQSAGYVSGITLSNNVAVAGTTSTASFAGQIGYMSISNNQNLDGIKFGSTSTNVTIEGNTFYGDVYNSSSGVLLGTSGTSTSLTVTNNVFDSRLTTILGGSNLKLIDLFSSSLTFTTNTVRYIEQAPAAIIGTVFIQTAGASPTLIIQGNKIEGPNRGDSDPATALSLSPGSLMDQSAVITIRHNTFRNRMASGGTFMMSDSGSSASIGFTASIRNNLFYTGVATTKFAMQFSRGAGNTISATIQDNAVYGDFAGNIQNQSSSDVGAGSGYITTNPYMQLADADTSNDNDVAPFSLLLNIDGVGTKIGATTSTRRTTVYVDDNGTIDYSTVDATTPGSVTSTLRSGDTLSLAAGTYPGFSINSSYVTTSLTIAGAGATTIINAGASQNALSITSVTSTSLSGLVLQNASTTSSGYASTRMNFAFGGNDYNEVSGDLSMGANTTGYVLDTDLNIISVTADGDSLAGATNIGTTNYHIALITTPSAERVTLLIPDSVWTNEAAFNADVGGMGVTTNAFAEDAFTVSGGTYTYQSAVVAAANMTLIGGLTTPAISQSTTYFAGLKLVSSGGATITNVTSAANGYGIWFASGGGSRIYDSVLSSSTGYDIRQDASVTNTIDNVTFTRTSSTVDALAAPLLVKFQARALLRRAANTATVLSGVAVTSTDSLSTATSLGSTGGDGYTSYTRLPAYTITNASAALTNGGYNPYTIAAGSISGYAASSTSATLSSRDQTVTIDLVSNVASTAPTSAAAGSITATTTAFTWTDNSDDETSFTINYVTSSLGEVLGVDSGSTSTTSAGVTSATFTLYPSLQYRFRVAAVGPGGTSTYATSSLFYTLAATPGAPTLTATGRTTATVVMDANGNSTSTEFLLYNSTLSSYVTSTGASVSSPYWTGTSTWATITIADLTCNTAYSFVAVARNGDATETSTSTAGTITTSACATSSSGGGGGGGVGASGATFIPTPITTPTPVTTSPTVPLPPIIVADTPGSVAPLPAPTDPGPLPPAAPATVRTLQTDARSFGVTLTAPDQERLASFVDNGTSAETRALGSGERRALVRDALHTMGRSNVPLSDLERMARGEIPATRNLVIERQQLPRVRATFRSLYNRDPNFKNADENLVWNTMMYRIRFPRNLAAEREGIQDFRQAFNRTPTDPFQWAVVRALGYVL